MTQTEAAASSGTRRTTLYVALAGGLVALGQAPVGFWPAGLLGLVLAAGFLSQAHTWRRAAWLGWVFGTAHFALALNWIVEPFLVDIARHGWMAPFALVFLSAGLALFWAFAFGLARGLGGRHSGWALAITFALTELARTYLFTGFPWAMVAHVWVDAWPIHWTAFVGTHGLNALTVLAAAAAATTYLGRNWVQFVAVVIFSAVVLAAPGLLRAPPPTEGGSVVRLVQPNAAQHLKWRRDMIEVFYERQLEFTAAAPQLGADPELIIWPETALPWMLDRAAPALEQMALASGGTPVIAGIQRRDAEGAYNSLVAIGAEGEVTDLYDKHHLVPFGEYMPGRWLFSRLGVAGIAALDREGYRRGPGPTLLDLGPLGQTLPLICYEAIFPQDVFGAPERPDWLLQITNDAWFGNFSGPFQHLAQARIRAIEQGLPMVRVANTGVSAVIDAHGAVQAALPLGVAGYLDHPLPAQLAPTLYARTGDWPVGIGLFLSLVALILLGRRSKLTD